MRETMDQESIAYATYDSQDNKVGFGYCGGIVRGTLDAAKRSLLYIP